MARNLRIFNNFNDYEAAELVRPAVSLVLSPRKVYFDPLSPTPPTPPTFNGKWKATYSDSSTSSAECDSTSAITENEISLTNLVSVEIGDCVTSFDDNAFAGCENLTSIDIPDNVTSIGMGAFYGCGITSIDIPDSVTSIGQYAFGNCTGLTSVTIGSGVTIIDEMTFYECSSLTNIDIPDNVTTINTGAFECESLTSVTIGSGITLIDTGAFGYSNLASVTIYAPTPPTVGDYPFGWTFDGTIYVPSGSVSAYSDWSEEGYNIQPIPNS